MEAVESLGHDIPEELLIANLCTHCCEYGQKEPKYEDAEVEVYFEENGKKYTTLLDSRDFKSVMNLRLRKYCSKIITLDNPFSIKGDIFYDYLNTDQAESEHVNELILPKELMKKDPVIFDEQEDGIDIEKIDEGENLEVDVVEDLKRHTSILENKVEALDMSCFRDDPSKKNQLLGLLKNNVKVFGDSDSPTSLSNLTPIECDLKEGRIFGVLNQHPLGYERGLFIEADSIDVEFWHHKS
eukprot:augustus_masked-scaffold_30-processed-gene-2.75-mRNA-1 protein AED:1.00 eAED:1.00 QI:0/0/0/0/1/1/3/0/240